MRMHLEYQYNWDDFLEAAHFVGPLKISKTQFWLRQLLFFAYFAVFLVFAVEDLRHGHHGTPTFWTKGVQGLLVPPGLLILVNALYRGAQRSGFIGLAPHTSAEITESGLTLRTRRAIAVSIWSEFARAIEGPVGFFLIRPNNSFILLPRRACRNSEEIEELRGTIAQFVAINLLDEPGRTAPDTRHAIANPERAPLNRLPIFSTAVSQSGLAAHERKAKLGLAIGLLAPLLGLTITLLIDPFGSSKHGFLAYLPAYICGPLGIASYLWGCWHLGGSRGFKPLHGLLVGLVIPPLGVLYLATRARPLDREVIDRQTFRGLLATPMAKAKDLRSNY